MGANRLIGAIGAPLSDYFWGIFLEYFQKIFKNNFIFWTFIE
jgi:hypothetical protein